MESRPGAANRYLQNRYASNLVETSKLVDLTPKTTAPPSLVLLYPNCWRLDGRPGAAASISRSLPPPLGRWISCILGILTKIARLSNENRDSLISERDIFLIKQKYWGKKEKRSSHQDGNSEYADSILSSYVFARGLGPWCSYPLSAPPSRFAASPSRGYTRTRPPPLPIRPPFPSRQFFKPFFFKLLIDNQSILSIDLPSRDSKKNHSSNAKFIFSILFACQGHSRYFLEVKKKSYANGWHWSHDIEKSYAAVERYASPRKSIKVHTFFSIA